MAEIKQPLSHPLKSAELHVPIRLGNGTTEGTLNATKVPGIKLEWIPGPFLKVTVKDIVHLLPAAAVKDSVVQDTH